MQQEDITPSLGLVYWELAVRTCLPGSTPQDYLMPYHDQVCHLLMLMLMLMLMLILMLMLMLMLPTPFLLGPPGPLYR